MTASEPGRLLRSQILAIAVRAIGEAVGIGLAVAFTGVVLALITPDTPSHGRVVVFTIAMAGALPGAGCWVLGRFSSRLLVVLQLAETRWRFVPSVLLGVAALLGALVLVFSVFVVWNVLAPFA